MVDFLRSVMPCSRILVITNIRLEERSLLSPHRVLANLSTFSLSLRQPLTHLRHLSARVCPAQGALDTQVMYAAAVVRYCMSSG